MASKHSRGDWKVCGDHMQIKSFKDKHDRFPKTICMTVEHQDRSVNSPIACDEGFANAKLMAASPKLYQAAIQFLEEWERGREWISEDTVDQFIRATMIAENKHPITYLANIDKETTQ